MDYLGINDKKENNFSEKVALILLRHRIRFQEGHWKPNEHLNQKGSMLFLIRNDNEIPF